jgi:hypothetical protein
MKASSDELAMNRATRRQKLHWPGISGRKQQIGYAKLHNGAAHYLRAVRNE